VADVELEELDDAVEALVADTLPDALDDAAVDALEPPEAPEPLEVLDVALEGVGPDPPPPSVDAPSEDLAPHAASSPARATFPRRLGPMFAMLTRPDDTTRDVALGQREARRRGAVERRSAQGRRARKRCACCCHRSSVLVSAS
jgi:hypothetical protein